MPTLPRIALPIAFAAALIAGAATVLADDAHEGPPYSGDAVKTITATLRGSDGVELGAVQLSQNAAGVVQLRVTGSGLTAGDHGLHIHAVGKCDGPAFTSAAGHFNPGAKKHGFDSPEGAHAGDMPNLTVAANGTFNYIETSDRVSVLSGATSIFDADGSALIIHAGADDHVTDPTGNSGARVACAVLAEASPAATTPAPTTAAPAPPNTGAGAMQSDGSATPALLAGLALILAAVAGGGFALRRR